MQATLQILTGPDTGRKIHLKSGQVAKFGRTEWCDFVFPYDPRMAEVHFAIETRPDAVVIVDLSKGGGVFVDGEKIETAKLNSGQKIQSGNLVFALTTEKLFESSGAGPIAVNQMTSAAPPQAELASKVCESVSLSEPALRLIDEQIEIVPFIDTLTEHGLLHDALRVLVAWLEKRKAIWWAADCVETSCEERLQDLVDLIDMTRTWVKDPTEDHRRNCAQAAETANTKLPACWLARAVGWSAGSLTPPELPVVPPAPHLSGEALMTALMLSAVYIDPAKANGHLQEFIKCGKQLSQSKLDWEASNGRT